MTDVKKYPARVYSCPSLRITLCGIKLFFEADAGQAMDNLRSDQTRSREEVPSDPQRRRSPKHFSLSQAAKL